MASLCVYRETVQFKKVRFCIWDVGGQDKVLASELYFLKGYFCLALVFAGWSS